MLTPKDFKTVLIFLLYQFQKHPTRNIYIFQIDLPLQVFNLYGLIITWTRLWSQLITKMVTQLVTQLVPK